MSGRKQNIIFTLALFCLTAAQAKVVYKNDEVTVTLSGKIANSTDIGVNASLLNNDAVGARGNKIDRAYANKSKIETTVNVKQEQGIEAQATFRSKFTWGNPRSSTTSTKIKYGESLIGSHTHSIGLNSVYVQELWIKLDMGDFFNSMLDSHSITAGLFPFQLGRGIALGANFAVDPSSLGFYSDKSVDQYAPGIKLSGNVLKDELQYDFYWSVMNNKTTKLKDTGDQIYDQLIINGAYVPNNKFARGSGDIDWRTAVRLRWTPFDDKEQEKKAYFEPYAMYARDPSQDLEATADASSRLGTFGLAADFQFGPFEFGFDGALNRGSQQVFALDRNKVVAQLQSDGTVKNVWSHVYDSSALTTKTTYDGSTTYRPTGDGISSALNGTQYESTGKYHASNRFRDAYTTKYKGWMFVADASVYFYEKQIKASAAAGISSGDTAPNTRTGERAGATRNYHGFITQQELYAGDRVKSFFVMGPAASLTRPSPLEKAVAFSTGAEGFTNLLFAGMGTTLIPDFCDKKLTVSPNVITFWNHIRVKKYGSTTEDASNRLGTEINCFMSYQKNKNMKFSLGGAFFLPGKHYTDLKGTALSAEVADLVKNAEAGATETLPTLGNSTAFVLSMGMEYKF